MVDVCIGWLYCAFLNCVLAGVHDDTIYEDDKIHLDVAYKIRSLCHFYLVWSFEWADFQGRIKAVTLTHACDTVVDHIFLN